jgi:hypothetical protein
VYYRDVSLIAQPFDPDLDKVDAKPVTITDEIACSAAGAIAWFVLSADGESFSRLLPVSMKVGLAGSIATVRLPAQFDHEANCGSRGPLRRVALHLRALMTRRATGTSGIAKHREESLLA